eukprot:jgi/Botrbrau1/17589/Bobra.0166s0031.1
MCTREPSEDSEMVSSITCRTSDGEGDEAAGRGQMMCEASNLVFSPSRLGHKKCPKGLSRGECAHLPDCSFSRGAFSACCDWPVFDSHDLPADHFRSLFSALRTYDFDQCPKVGRIEAIPTLFVGRGMGEGHGSPCPHGTSVKRLHHAECF